MRVGSSPAYPINSIIKGVKLAKNDEIVCRSCDRLMKLTMVTNDDYLVEGEEFTKLYECETCNNYSRKENSSK